MQTGLFAAALAALFASGVAAAPATADETLP
jgi:hypothetical protein